MGLDAMDRILADAVNEFSAPLGGPSYLTALLSPPPVRPKAEAPAASPAATTQATTSPAATQVEAPAAGISPAATQDGEKATAVPATAAEVDVLALPAAVSWGSDCEDEDIFQKKTTVAVPVATATATAAAVAAVKKRAPRAKKA